MDEADVKQLESPQDQTLYAWKAPLRPFKKRSTALLRFFLAVALLVSAVVFFFGDMVTVVPIWAILFLFYIFSVTPPPTVENRITLFGIENAGVTLRWDILSHYYFDERLGFRVLVLVTHGPYFAHSYLVVPDEDTKNRVHTILSQHLMYITNPQKTFTDRLVKFFSALVPEEHPVVTNSPET